MDINKSLELLDSLYTEGDLEQAEYYLDKWIMESLETRNYPATLTFFNEMEGLLRTTGRAEDAAEVGEQALELINMMGLDGSVHHATTLQNVATANRVAGNLDKAQDMYIRAAEIYRYLGYRETYEMASLYHNLSHIQQEKNQHKTALMYLETAFDIISSLPENEAELATTKICMALSYMALEELEKAKNHLDDAFEYYESETGQNDGHYGSALSALAEFHWHKNEFEKTIETFEKALEFTLRRYGENQGCEVIRSNIETVKREMEESVEEN